MGSHRFARNLLDDLWYCFQPTYGLYPQGGRFQAGPLDGALNCSADEPSNGGSDPAYREPWLAKTPGGRRPTPRGPRAEGRPQVTPSLAHQRRGRASPLEAGRAFCPRRSQGRPCGRCCAALRGRADPEEEHRPAYREPWLREDPQRQTTQSRGVRARKGTEGGI